MRRDIMTGRNYTSKLVRPAQCSVDSVHRVMRVVQCLFQCTNKSDYESRIIDDEIYGWFARTIDRLIRNHADVLFNYFQNHFSRVSLLPNLIL